MLSTGNIHFASKIWKKHTRLCRYGNISRDDLHLYKLSRWHVKQDGRYDAVGPLKQIIVILWNAGFLRIRHITQASFVKIGSVVSGMSLVTKETQTHKLFK